MEIISLENLPRSISFFQVYGLNQTWINVKKWNCIGEPRNQHGFMYIFCDGVSFYTKGSSEPIEFQKGDLIYIPKDSEYTVEFQNTKGEFSNILINFDICDRNGKNYALAKDIVCLAKDPPAKITDSMLTVTHLSCNLTHPTLPVTSAFYVLLDQLTNHLLATRLHASEKDSVLPAIYYLDSHILDDVSIPQLAQMCLLNESAFRKTFKAHTGMNPVQYKIKIKIDKAKLMLRSTSEIPIEAIAESLGFYDNAYFHKVFLKHTQKTPKQYRDEHM